MNEADRQILFGLVAIRLKLVSLAQVSRALSDWSANGERSLARLLIERRQLDETSGALGGIGRPAPCGDGRGQCGVEPRVVHGQRRPRGAAARARADEEAGAGRGEDGGPRRQPVAAAASARGQRPVQAARRDACRCRAGRTIARDADLRRRFRVAAQTFEILRPLAAGAWARCSWPGMAG